MGRDQGRRWMRSVGGCVGVGWWVEAGSRGLLIATGMGVGYALSSPCDGAAQDLARELVGEGYGALTSRRRRPGEGGCPSSRAEHVIGHVLTDDASDCQVCVPDDVGRQRDSGSERARGDAEQYSLRAWQPDRVSLDRDSRTTTSMRLRQRLTASRSDGARARPRDLRADEDMVRRWSGP